MRHDYDLPPDWESMTPEERDKWMKEERCRRRAMKQDTAFKHRIEKAQKRLQRREQAKFSSYE